MDQTTTLNTSTIQMIIWGLYFAFFVQFCTLTYNLYYSLPSEELDEEEEEYDDDDNLVVTKPIIYEEKYIDKLKLLSMSEKTEDQLKQLQNSIIMEKTPLGNVIMYWNNDRKTFTFHADSTIPYRYLEVVARKYVIQNQCKQLYIFEETEEKKVIQETEEKKVIQETEEKKVIQEEEKASTVFAKFKTYNQGSIQSVKTMQQKGIGQGQRQRAPVNVKREYTKPVQENANRYTYEGKIVNFSFLKKERKTGKRVLTFAEYKKMCEKI